MTHEPADRVSGGRIRATAQPMGAIPVLGLEAPVIYASDIEPGGVYASVGDEHREVIGKDGSKLWCVVRQTGFASQKKEGDVIEMKVGDFTKWATWVIA